MRNLYILTLCITSLSAHYTKRIDSRRLPDELITHTYYVYNDADRAPKPSSRKAYEFVATLVAAIGYGAVSGYACRMFERLCLQDMFLLRLANICIWGLAQESCLQSLCSDLRANGVHHSSKLMHTFSWASSWMQYITS